MSAVGATPVPARPGTLVSLVFVFSLDRWKLAAGVLALTVGAGVYVLSGRRAVL